MWPLGRSSVEMFRQTSILVLRSFAFNRSRKFLSLTRTGSEFPQNGLDRRGSACFERRFCPGVEQGRDRSGVVSIRRVPAILGTVNGPTHRRGVIIVIDCFKRWVEAKDQARQFGLTMKGRPVERHAAVLSARVYRPAGFQHQAHRIQVALLGRVHKFAPFRDRQ